MLYAGTLLVGILIGYALCYFAQSPAHGTHDSTVLVKRSRPSLRSPLRTHNVKYDKYKTNENLYSAVKATGGKKEEVELGR